MPDGKPTRSAEILSDHVRRVTGAAASVEHAAASRPAEDLNAALRDVMRLAREVTSILDLQPLLQTVIEAFVEITAAERGSLLLFDAQGELELSASHGTAAGQVDSGTFAIPHSTIRSVADSANALYVEDVLTQGSVGIRDSIHLLQLRSYACLPLVASGRVLGVCYTDSRKPGRALDASDRVLLESFAAQAALAIENARRHSELLANKTRLEAENESLRRQIAGKPVFDSMVGASPAMERLFEIIDRAARSAVSVLVLGETGTGKELVARALHLNSPRRTGPFVAVNAGSLHAELFGSELFGHKRGAFTGAIEDRLGLFETANGGTLFIDEIAELPLTLQPQLLRVLQEREIRRLGESQDRKIDVRVIAATNKDLQEKIRLGEFRDDLYFRLRVVNIRVPPLRERGNDLLLLAEAFTRRFAAQYDKGNLELAPSALRWLLARDWTGNVRQLENCIHQAVALADPDATLTGEFLTSEEPPEGGRRDLGKGSLREILAEVERQAIQNALEECDGNVLAAAQRLGVSRQYLHTLKKNHGIVVEPRRSPRKTSSKEQSVSD